MFDNIDHGSLPAGQKAIKESLELNNSQYGLLGSFVFFGLTVGSIFGTFMFNCVSTKWILILSLLLNGLVLWALTMTKDFRLLLTFRFLTGFSQVFVAIFLPVWSDRRAPSEASKQCWLTGLLVASSVGVLLGYVITALFI